MKNHEKFTLITSQAKFPNKCRETGYHDQPVSQVIDKRASVRTHLPTTTTKSKGITKGSVRCRRVGRGVSGGRKRLERRFHIYNLLSSIAMLPFCVVHCIQRPDWNAPPGVFHTAQTATLFISSCKARINVISSMSASAVGCPARRPALIAFRILDSTDRCLSFRNWCIPGRLLRHTTHYPPPRFSLNRAIARSLFFEPPRSASSALA